jgi:hypothetical protein
MSFSDAAENFEQGVEGNPRAANLPPSPAHAFPGRHAFTVRFHRRRHGMRNRIAEFSGTGNWRS